MQEDGFFAPLLWRAIFILTSPILLESLVQMYQVPCLRLLKYGQIERRRGSMILMKYNEMQWRLFGLPYRMV